MMPGAAQRANWPVIEAGLSLQSVRESKKTDRSSPPGLITDYRPTMKTLTNIECVVTRRRKTTFVPYCEKFFRSDGHQNSLKTLDYKSNIKCYKSGPVTMQILPH